MSTVTSYKYHIITFGCQMNRNDSERLESILQHMGLTAGTGLEEADVIIMNSCSVRAAAEHRVFGQAKNLQALRERKPHLIVGVTGCMPGRDKDGSMGQKLMGVDLYFPTKDMTQLPTWLSALNPDLRSGADMNQDYLQLRPTYHKKYQAYVTIQTGCNHFCTYCVVPYARGLEVNRPVRDILQEIYDLADSGCREVTLLGQIVNHYLAPDPEHFSTHNPYKNPRNYFARLLWEVNQIVGIERVHWTAPHPSYMDDELLDALTLPKQVNYIHLPVQSGNTEVLRRMNRRYTRDEFIAIIAKIRAKKPHIAIGTDIIVGFGGETDQQFADTVSLYKICDFDISYHAQYSARSGTLATKVYADSVSTAEKKQRWTVLQQLMEQTTWRKNQIYVGQTVSVLADDYRPGWCEGNSREMKRVRFKACPELIGTMVDVEIFKADTWLLWGKKK